VIVALPDAAELNIVSDWIANEGYEPIRRTTAKAAAEDIHSRSFTLLVADADLAFRDGLHRVGQRRNPSTPTVIIGDDEAARQCDAAGVSAIHVGRPVEQPTFVCLMSMAILDGRPVRRSERKMVQRFAAQVNGAPAFILDISNEGVRVEIPPDGRSIPPTFTLRVPMIGVGVNVQRMWSRSQTTAQGRAGATWCGGALAANSPKAEQGWRRFVSTVDSISGSAISTVLDIA
jgi:hypothetical protein